MALLNIHTHTPPREDEQIVPSLGLHPWYLSHSWKEELLNMENELKSMMRPEQEASPSGFHPMFIGECGLDRCCITPYDRQLAAFEAQIQLSEDFGLPILLHCVRAVDDVLRLKQGTLQPWIFHGFRGKPQQLQQLLSHGFYVSFGFRYNADSLRACPLNRLFLETDDLPQPIAPLYDAVSELLNTTSQELNQQLYHNLASLTSEAI